MSEAWVLVSRNALHAVLDDQDDSDFEFVTLPTLPPELWAEIAGHISGTTLLNLRRVSHALCDIVTPLLVDTWPVPLTLIGVPCSAVHWQLNCIQQLRALQNPTFAIAASIREIIIDMSMQHSHTTKNISPIAPIPFRDQRSTFRQEFIWAMTLLSMRCWSIHTLTLRFRSNIADVLQGWQEILCNELPTLLANYSFDKLVNVDLSSFGPEMGPYPVQMLWRMLMPLRAQLRALRLRWTHWPDMVQMTSVYLPHFLALTSLRIDGNANIPDPTVLISVWKWPPKLERLGIGFSSSCTNQVSILEFILSQPSSTMRVFEIFDASVDSPLEGLLASPQAMPSQAFPSLTRLTVIKTSPVTQANLNRVLCIFRSLPILTLELGLWVSHPPATTNLLDSILTAHASHSGWTKVKEISISWAMLAHLKSEADTWKRMCRSFRVTHLSMDHEWMEMDWKYGV